ncbi:MFS transporter [Leucobacter chinensis]|uniref:MFS transporter n=1 Tax=Leucobacter chinensis TaxID=2851010 RepID=UPI001C2399CF|nr:MFS transporter [Leucobacter chinensis]
MNEPHERPKKSRLFVDLAPFTASPAFTRLYIGNSVSLIGSQMTIVAVGMHVYDLTGSTLAVSMVALWALGPMIVAGLWGGMLADVFDRRTLSLVTATVSWASIGALAVISFLGVTETWPLYLLAALNASAATILGATRSAIMPRILPPNLIPQASALFGISFGIGVAVGPALGGVLVSSVGFGYTYLVDVVLFTAGFLGVLSLPPIAPEGEAEKPGLRSLIEGWQFLKRSPNIRATFVFDIIAMVFGQPRVTFPAIGMVVLGGGYTTAGMLTAAVAVGAFLSSLGSGWVGNVRRQGAAVTGAIAVYGLSIAMFGVVILVAQVTGQATEDTPRTLFIVLAFIALAASGASDNISAVFRSTILQVSAPDHMRGRLQGIFTIVVTGGPRLGDLWAGMLTATLFLWVPSVVGGVIIMVFMGCAVKLARGFMAYDSTDPKP